MTPRPRAIVVASHRRSGTHLLIDSLRNNVRDVAADYLNVDHIQPDHPQHMPLAEFDRRLRSTSGIAIVKTHALPDGDGWKDPAAREYLVRLLAELPTIYVYRDGRDVLTSLYHYIGAYEPRVAATPFGEFIRATYTAEEAHGLNRTAFWQRHVLAWLDHGPTATVSYERLRHDVGGALGAIAGDVGFEMRSRVTPVPLPGSQPRPGPLRLLARRLVKPFRRKRSTAISPRTGTSGGWRGSFGPGDGEWFLEIAGNAMQRLGYQDGVEARRR